MKGPDSKRIRSENLQQLYTLCENLSGRDDQLKKDLQMFEDFFCSFPIPVTMWSIGKDHVVLSKWGNAFTCKKPKNLEEIFECPELRNESVKKHEMALQGNPVSYFVEHETRLFWCKLVPRRNDLAEVLGVTGMAWDVTSNAVMLHGLEKIIELLDSEASFSEIKNEALAALSASRLHKMLAEREEESVQ